MKKRLLILGLGFLLLSNVKAQLEKDLKDYVDYYADPKNEMHLIDLPKSMLDSVNAQKLIDFFEQYRTDTSIKKRLFAYKTLMSITRTTKSKYYKRKLIEKSLWAFFDSAYFIRVTTGSIVYSGLPKDEFSTQSKAIIQSLYLPKNRKFITDRAKLLMGFLDINFDSLVKYTDTLRRVSYSGKEPRLEEYEDWYGHLALARMGYKPSIKLVVAQWMNLITFIPLVTTHKSLLEYLKIREVIPVYLRVLSSEERRGAFSSGTYKTLVAFDVIPLLCRAIKKFPLQEKVVPAMSYNENDVRTAIQWLEQNKDRLEFNTDEF